MNSNLDRRKMLQLLGAAGFATLTLPAYGFQHDHPPAVSPEEALRRLKEGNQRFVQGKLLHQNQDPSRRAATSGGQQPFASILGCSDSRVPPEVIFDLGLGDIFTARVAGNVVDTDLMG